jgi:hypothetical protein
MTPEHKAAMIDIVRSHYDLSRIPHTREDEVCIFDEMMVPLGGCGTVEKLIEDICHYFEKEAFELEIIRGPRRPAQMSQESLNYYLSVSHTDPK